MIVYFEIVYYSDPTYEAWKQCIKSESLKINLDSDPTYEAWKLIFVY